jgi:GntR family transcriptional regulator
MIARGRRPSSEWISRSQGQVTPEEAFLLGLSPGTVVYRFQRIRYADGQTMALEYSTIPASCLPSEQFVDTSLYAALAQHGNRPVRALQRLRAINFSKDHAEQLGISPGDAGLFIERRGFLRDGQTCEFTQSYYRGDAYDVIAELNEPF